MAAQAEEQQSGGSFILEHIIDHHELHLGPLHIPLPHIEFFGIDMSITGHLVMMWVASLLLILHPDLFLQNDADSFPRALPMRLKPSPYLSATISPCPILESGTRLNTCRF